MMALPFEVLTLGICLSQVLSKPGESQPRRDWAVVVLLGLLIGSLRWLNSWDYPPFLLVGITSIGIGERHIDGGWWATGKRVILKVGALVVLSFLLFKPFLDAYQTPVAGLHSSPEQTPIHQYLAHFGAFLALIGAWLVFMTVRALRPSPLVRGVESRGQQIWTALVSVGAFAVALVAFAAVLRGYALVGLLVPFLVLVVYLAGRELRLRRPDSGPRLFLLMLIGLGLGLSAGVDLVTLDGDIVRMNTVFKFYEHIWIAFALTAAFAAWYFVFVIWQPALSSRRLPLSKSAASDDAKALLRPERAFGAHRLLPRVLAIAGSLGLALLLLSVLLYPLFATKPRLDDRFAKLPATLDGEAYMQNAVYSDEKGKIDLGADLQGIEWMRQNVKGTPPIVEGRTPLYRWGGRFSIYTGLPAVLGWDWHQTQQRGKLSYMVDQRGSAVDSFYANPDEANALRFLRQYGVQYVIVGQVERLYYPAGGLAKFSTGLGGVLSVAYENPQLRIYKVNDDRLTTLLGTTLVSQPVLTPPSGQQ